MVLYLFLGSFACLEGEGEGEGEGDGMEGWRDGGRERW